MQLVSCPRHMGICGQRSALIGQLLWSAYEALQFYWVVINDRISKL